MNEPSSSIDPVCGMTVKPESAAAKAVYQAQTYYFCSTHCHAKFTQAPATYVHPAATDTTAHADPVQRASAPR